MKHTLLTALLLTPLATLHAAEPHLNVLLIITDDFGYPEGGFICPTMGEPPD